MSDTHKETGERNTITVAKHFPADDSQAEQGKRAEGLKQVLEQFTKQGDTYRYKDLPTVVAFSDYGDRIATDLDNDDVAVAMTNLAQSKGWQYYIAKGSEPFYSAVEKQTARIDECEQLAQSSSPEIPVTDNGQPAISTPEPPAKPKQPRMTNTVAGEKVDTADDANEQLRRQALAQSVNNQYRVAGSKYYFKDQAGHVNQLAFKDTGAKLATALNTERVTRSIVDLAESKGWADIKVSGHKEFKRQVWRAATERGIHVQGYKPDAQDLATVPEQPLNNTVQPVTALDKAADKTPAAKVPRNTDGVLVAHGPAPYQNNPANRESYFVTIDNGNQQRTVWGVGLRDAISASHAQIGETILVRLKGSEPVQVQDNGKAVASVRNAWTIQRADKREVITAVADAVTARHITNETDRQRVADAMQQRMDMDSDELPQVQVYDNKATQSAVVHPAKARTQALELTR